MSNTVLARKFHGLEIMMDNIRIEQHLIPEGVNMEEFDIYNLEYFKKYGFKVSNLFSILYEKAGGIASEKYIPASLYLYYITPYLVNLNLAKAYVDKNAYEYVFSDVKQPQTIVHNANGKFFRRLGSQYLSIEEVIELLSDEERFIIKPALETGKGRDVQLITTPHQTTELKELIHYYESDFIIQRSVDQHSDLAILNPTSLNTLRVYTFLPLNHKEYKVLGAAVRFGGEGAIKDNASTGGGFCKVHIDGTIDDRICQYKSWKKRSLKEEKGLFDFKFPSFQKAIELCLNTHAKIPYMDLIGWDISIDQQGDPVLIEINQYPDCELIQLSNGPMFGEYTDSILEAISKNSTHYINCAKRTFPDISSHHNYIFEIGKLNTI